VGRARPKRRREPDNGTHEKALLKEMQVAFGHLDSAIEKAKQPGIVHEGDSKRLVDEPAVQAAAKRLGQIALELRDAIYDDQYRRIAIAKTQTNRNMAVIIATAVVGVLIMAGLLRFFYGWIFRPLNELQEGVRRVAAGNFEGEIDLKSGDELEELANAFNDMTSRLRVKYSDLTNQVTERGKQLVRSERLASVGFLAAGVAHEINNPLASIAMCAESLEGRMEDALDEIEQQLAMTSIDLAVNIHSFSECCASAIDWWLVQGIDRRFRELGRCRTNGPNPDSLARRSLGILRIVPSPHGALASPSDVRADNKYSQRDQRCAMF
jgi:methyl-accepting chemotaxis protein